MKKNLLFISFFFIAWSSFCSNKKIIDKLEYPIVIEQKAESEYAMICTNGMVFIKADFAVENDRSFPFVFLLDTGSASSSFFSEDFFYSDDFILYQIDGSNYLLGDAKCEGFTVNNLFLYENNNHNSILAELKKIFGSKYYFGIIGNDVLMQKSFLLSISQGYFKWTDRNPFDEQDDCISPDMDRVCSTRGKTDFYQYSIYIEDKYFKSNVNDNPIFGFFNSPDKSKSRYFIDTGTYYIATSMIDLYYQIKEHDYNNIIYKTEIASQIGFCEIPKMNLLEKVFFGVQVMAGGTPEFFKCLGNQVLAAFDIFFDKENSTKVQKVYLRKVADDFYQIYRTKNDAAYYYPAYSFGFSMNLNGRVTRKAFLNEKELLRDVEIGDEIISFNDIPYEMVCLWKLPEKITIHIKKKNGKIKSVSAKKYHLK